MQTLLRTLGRAGGYGPSRYASASIIVCKSNLDAANWRRNRLLLLFRSQGEFNKVKMIYTSILLQKS
jgi:hypothetical protein